VTPTLGLPCSTLVVAAGSAGLGAQAASESTNVRTNSTAINFFTESPPHI